jgi:myo-inositol 2-dehydrogenase / D-chiro-inositol 1-dehydrogenase
MTSFGVALLGAGRMGQEHARNLAGIPSAHVVVVADPVPEAAQAAQRACRADSMVLDAREAIDHPGVEVVLIVTPTDTHAELTEHAARAGRAIFCEKPVALDLAETQRVMQVVQDAGVPFQIGFNRRFDPGFDGARQQVAAGAIGPVEQFRAVGRDPGPPPIEYLRVSGGQFVDQVVHEFDMARYIVGEVEEVQAWGAVHVDSRIGDLGDTDTATTLLRFANGAIGVVESSRRAVYGYDIRAEVFGAHGKLVVDATPKTPVYRYRKGGFEADHYHFFMDRFEQAFRLELEAFFRALKNDEVPSPGPRDAVEALRIALAARTSYLENRPVRVEDIR